MEEIGVEIRWQCLFIIFEGLPVWFYSSRTVPLIFNAKSHMRRSESVKFSNDLIHLSFMEKTECWWNKGNLHQPIVLLGSSRGRNCSNKAGIQSHHFKTIHHRKIFLCTGFLKQWELWRAKPTCEYENSSPVTEKTTSAHVRRKYWGICQAIWTVLGGISSE